MADPKLDELGPRVFAAAAVDPMAHLREIMAAGVVRVAAGGGADAAPKILPVEHGPDPFAIPNVQIAAAPFNPVQGRGQAFSQTQTPPGYPFGGNMLVSRPKATGMPGLGQTQPLPISALTPMPGMLPESPNPAESTRWVLDNIARQDIAVDLWLLQDLLAQVPQEETPVDPGTDPWGPVSPTYLGGFSAYDQKASKLKTSKDSNGNPCTHRLWIRAHLFFAAKVYGQEYTPNAIGCELHAVVSPKCPGIVVTNCYVKSLSYDTGVGEIDFDKSTRKDHKDWMNPPEGQPKDHKKADYWKSTEIWNDGYANPKKDITDFTIAAMPKGTKIIMEAVAKDSDNCRTAVTVVLVLAG